METCNEIEGAGLYYPNIIQGKTRGLFLTVSLQTERHVFALLYWNHHEESGQGDRLNLLAFPVTSPLTRPPSHLLEPEDPPCRIPQRIRTRTRRSHLLVICLGVLSSLYPMPLTISHYHKKTFCVPVSCIWEDVQSWQIEGKMEHTGCD